MDSALAENRRLRNARLVKNHLASHGCKIETLFETAYFLKYGALDRYEVETDLGSFKLSEDPPEYVVSYLCMKQN